MEEVSDDTNGESSFEFISGKIDENSAKGNDNQSYIGNFLLGKLLYSFFVVYRNSVSVNGLLHLLKIR